MAKFNETQKKKRAAKSERKRAIHGDPVTGKLKIKAQPLSVSGKRKQKLLKKWRRDQKEVMEKGLLTVQDVEMAAADGTSEGTGKSPKKFNVKKNLKLNNLIKRKGKKKKNSKPPTETSAQAMVE